MHTHEVLHERPWIVFPGNTQGRHIRETGPKGCVVVTVDNGEARLKHVPLDVVRWKLLSIELQADDDLDALLARTRAALDLARSEADGRLLAVRLIVAGACVAHLAVTADRQKVESELRALTFEWRDEVWLEEIRLHTRPPLALDELRASEGFLGELLRAPPEGLPAALKLLGDRPEVKEAGLDLSDEALLRELTADAEALLATRLTR